MPATVPVKSTKGHKTPSALASEDRGEVLAGRIYFASGKRAAGFLKVTQSLPKGVRAGLILENEAARRAVTKLDPDMQFEIIEARATPKADELSRPDGSRSSPPSPDDSALGAAAYEPSLQAQLLARGVTRRRSDLVSAEGTYDLEQVRELMNGVTPQAISKRVREGSVLAVPGPSNRRRYPAVQFLSDGSVVEGLRAVKQVFPSQSPWMMLNFLVNGDRALGGARPIDVLKSGDVQRVVEVARRIGIQGA